MKPTKAELLQQVSRGGRIFCFQATPQDANILSFGWNIPSQEAEYYITNAILNLPGVESVDGPHINGVISITVDDTEAPGLSDEAWMNTIATIIHKYWKER